MESKLKCLLDNVKERWEGSTKSMQKNDYREIFANPTKQELRELEDINNSDSNIIKFIAVKNKREVYVASYDVYHYKIAEEVGVDSDYEMKNFPGKGRIENGVVNVTVYSDALNFKKEMKYDEKYMERAEVLYKEVLDGVWDWVEKYNFDLKELKKRTDVWLEKGIKKLK